MPTKHRRDIDNAATSILDLLQDTFIIHDDDWKISISRYERGDDSLNSIYSHLDGNRSNDRYGLFINNYD